MSEVFARCEEVRRTEVGGVVARAGRNARGVDGRLVGCSTR